MIFDIKKLGKEFKQKRESLKQSHRTVSQKIKVPHCTLHRLEKNKQKDVHVKTLVKILNWMEADITEFLLIK